MNGFIFKLNVMRKEFLFGNSKVKDLNYDEKRAKNLAGMLINNF